MTLVGWDYEGYYILMRNLNLNVFFSYIHFVRLTKLSDDVIAKSEV